MKTLIYVVLGAIVGGGFLSMFGAIVGGLLAYVLSRIVALTDLVNRQQRQIELLHKRMLSNETLSNKQGAVNNTLQGNLEQGIFESAAPDTIATEDTAASDSSTNSMPASPVSTSPVSTSPVSTTYASTSPVSTNPVSTTYASTNSATANDNSQAGQTAMSAVATDEPGWLQSRLALFIEKTNIITRIGIVILFFGVGFLIKFSAEHVVVPIELRLLGIALLGVVLMVSGQRLLTSRRDYALLLQGGAVGLWYLTTFAAMRIFDVIPVGVGFIVLVALAVFSCLLAVRRDSSLLAVFAVLGGFAAPILSSTGQGSHITLFAYYALLNAGIVGIVWFKNWRSLTLVGFVFTWVVGVAWGVTTYRAEHFSSTEPFLLLFMLFYMAIPLLYSLGKQWQTQPVLDGPLVFGTPAIAFVLQCALVDDFAYGKAMSALGFGLLYLAAVWLWRDKLKARAPLVFESYLGVGCVLASLSIVFFFDYDVAAALWAIEGAAALWLAHRQGRSWGVALALLAQVAAGLSYAIDKPSLGGVLFLNPAFAIAALIGLAGFFSAWILRAQSWHTPRVIEHSVLVWAMLWWLGAGVWQVDIHLTSADEPAGLLLYVVVVAVMLQTIQQRFQWRALSIYIMATLPALLLIALFSVVQLDHPFARFSALAWGLAIAVLYWLHRQQNTLLTHSQLPQGKQLLQIWYALSYCLPVALLLWEVQWQMIERTLVPGWPPVAQGFVLLAAFWLPLKCTFWPQSFDLVHHQWIIAIVSIALIVVTLIGLELYPLLPPFKYIPLFNPLDIFQVLALLSITYWWRTNPNTVQRYLEPRVGWSVLAALSFAVLNLILLRTLHVFAGIAFDERAMISSDLVQTSLSIVWTLLGIVLLWIASRRASRQVWFAGIALVGVVVLKLFIVDFSNSATVERIISFIVVGLLLLGVGYLVPLPEKAQNQRQVAIKE